MRISDWSSDVCSSDLPDSERAKIALFCNVSKDAVIPALDADSIYGVPLQYHAEGLDEQVLAAFGIKDAPPPALARWEEILERVHHPEGEVTLGVVGKYTGLKDAYKSLQGAPVHRGITHQATGQLKWLDGELFAKGKHFAQHCKQIS